RSRALRAGREDEVATISRVSLSCSAPHGPLAASGSRACGGVEATGRGAEEEDGGGGGDFDARRGPGARAGIFENRVSGVVPASACVRVTGRGAAAAFVRGGGAEAACACDGAFAWTDRCAVGPPASPTASAREGGTDSSEVSSSSTSESSF